jgi:DNA-binding MarR family transcriptional regulator
MCYFMKQILDIYLEKHIGRLPNYWKGEQMVAPPDECAHEVLDVIPLVMRAIRAELRSHRAVDLTVPQFRVLVFLKNNPGVSLNEVSAHLGLTPPSTSKLIDGLFERQLVLRHTCVEDRRRVKLTLTEKGASLLETSYQETRARFEERLSILTEPERAIVVQAMQALRSVFSLRVADANS